MGIGPLLLRVIWSFRFRIAHRKNTVHSSPSVIASTPLLSEALEATAALLRLGWHTLTCGVSRNSLAV